jgi:hypothetical protein
MAEIENASGTKKQKGETFLLRLPVDLRAQLDVYRTEVKAKSLQTVITQFILKGLNMPKADFTTGKLFSKDLHAGQLGKAVGHGTDIELSNTRISLDRKGTQNRPVNVQALVGAHEQVLESLETQKLTSFAALMDPALMSYRLLLDFCFEDPNSRNAESLKRDFSNGLWFAAEKAMERKKWNFAQILLRQACDLDPENTELGLAAGIYLIKRLMMKNWLRTKESIGVPEVKLITQLGVGEGSSATADDSDAESDQTEWAIAADAYELLHRGVPVSMETATILASDRNMNHGGSGKLSCWRDLAFIIRWAANPESDGSMHKSYEEMLISRIKNAFNEWQQTFRMTRELSALQREWSGWLDALEVFWWLGYRKEAFEIANNVRSFSSDKDGITRLLRIQNWNPETEELKPVGLNHQDQIFFNRVQSEGIGYDQDNPYTELISYPFRAKLV